jgi:hypothetical protein
MATIKKHVVDAALISKGVRQASSDHYRMIYFDLNNQKTAINTKTSHGHSGMDIGDSLISKMARQCRLPKVLFLNLVNCPLSQEAYQSELEASGHL